MEATGTGAEALSPGEKRIWTIPNVLSFLRLGSVPVFIYLFVEGRTDAAVILYTVGAWTDFFDGYIARKTDSVTELGRLLDPLADRVFIAALVVALVATDVLPLWAALAIVGRDVAILGVYPFVHRGTLARIRVNFVGKTATAALLLGLSFLAVTETSLSWGDIFEIPGYLFVVIGGVLYWISGGMYAREALALRASTGTGADLGT